MKQDETIQACIGFHGMISLKMLNNFLTNYTPADERTKGLRINYIFTGI